MGIETFPINAAYRVSDSVQAGPRQMLGAWHKEANAKGKSVNGYCSSKSRNPNAMALPLFTTGKLSIRSVRTNQVSQ